MKVTESVAILMAETRMNHHIGGATVAYFQSNSLEFKFLFLVPETIDDSKWRFQANAGPYLPIYDNISHETNFPSSSPVGLPTKIEKSNCFPAKSELLSQLRNFFMVKSVNPYLYSKSQVLPAEIPRFCLKFRIFMDQPHFFREIMSNLKISKQNATFPPQH